MAALATIISVVPQLWAMAKAIHPSAKLEDIITKFDLDKRFGSKKAYKIAKKVIWLAKKVGLGGAALDASVPQGEVDELLNAEDLITGSGFPSSKATPKRRQKRRGSGVASGSAAPF